MFLQTYINLHFIQNIYKKILIARKLYVVLFNPFFLIAFLWHRTVRWINQKFHHQRYVRTLRFALRTVETHFRRQLCQNWDSDIWSIFCDRISLCKMSLVSHVKFVSCQVCSFTIQPHTHKQINKLTTCLWRINEMSVFSTFSFSMN